MYGVIDINTDAVTLVIYTVSNNKLIQILSKKHSINLPTYVDANNNLKDSGVESITKILLSYKQVLSNMNVTEVLTFTTYVIKGLPNRTEVLEHLTEKTGFNIKILSNEDKIIYDYYGAMQSVKIIDGVLVDISSNSVRLIFHENSEIVQSAVLPFGSLTFFNNYVDNIVPDKCEIEIMQNQVREHLKDINIPNTTALSTRIYTVGRVARCILQLINNSNSTNIKNNQYSVNELRKLSLLSVESINALTKQISNTMPEAINIFLPGLIILNEIVSYFNSEEILVSYTGVREGYVQSILKQMGIIQ